jgi:hypothetical protein
MSAISKHLALALIVGLVWASPVAAGESKWIGVVAGNVTAARYTVPIGGLVANSSEANGQIPIPVAGTVTKLIAHASAAPDGDLGTGGTQSWTVTLREAGADTAATCTISEAETDCTQWTGSEAIAANALLSLAIVPNAVGTDPDAANISWAIEFSHASKFVSGFTVSGNLSAAATNMLPIQGDGTSAPTSDVNSASVMPLAGSWTDLCVTLLTAPAAGTTRVFTGSVNATEDSTLQVTFTDADASPTTRCDTATISVSAGNRLSVESAVTGTPGASRVLIGVAIDPTTDGAFPLISTANAATDTVSARYIPLSGAMYTPNATESTFQEETQTDYTITSCWAYPSVSPSPGNYTIVLRENTANASTTFSIQLTALSAVEGTGTAFTPASGGLLAGEVTPASSPAAARVHWACAGYIAPSVGGGPPPSGHLLLGVGAPGDE